MQLVSPNQAPEDGSPRIKYPPDYDRKAQKVVLSAYYKLKDNAPRSFPFVSEHLADKRYALTEDAGDFMKNYLVRDLCRDVIVGNLQPDVWGHKPGGTSYRTRPRQPDYIRHFGVLGFGKKDWWMAHRDKSLIDLQIEVMEFVVAEAKKQPDKYTQDELSKWNLELEKLQTTKTPRRTPSMFSQ